MVKLLVVCGPTGVGKTELAIKLAEDFDGEIISADSRQVYRGMDIATGKDLPVNSKFKSQNSKLQLKTKNFQIGYYLFDEVPVWMLDVVKPTQAFSVADYCELAYKVMQAIWSRGKLPILVGGTGLYIKAVIDGIGTLNVRPNKELRREYAEKNAEELLGSLKDIAPEKADSMNESDRKNPRRLIRALEIASWKTEVGPFDFAQGKSGNDVLQIGLAADPDFLKSEIKERIALWIKAGAEDETKKLIESGVSWDSQAMNAIGYREWREYIGEDTSLDNVMGEWEKDEWQYAKRQMTWFRKDKRIKWFDISKAGFTEKVERLVRSWYTKANAND